MSSLRQVFFGGKGVRSGWRLLVFWVGGFMLSICGGVFSMVFMAVLGESIAIANPAIQILITTPAILAFPMWSLVCALMFGEGLRGSGLGGPFFRSLAELTAGTTVGALLIFAGVGLVALTGFAVEGVSVSVSLVEEPELWMLLAWIPALLMMSLWEEALFRGYGLMWTGRAFGNVLQMILPQSTAARKRLLHGLGKLPPLFISCLFFALLHLGNPSNSGILPTVNTALAGLWLAIPLYRSRALWWSWGMHFGWNACMGLVLGIEVSGVEMGKVVKTVLTGPDWIAGGGYGLEGSLAGTVVLVFGLFVALVSPRRKDVDAAQALVVLDRGGLA